MGSVGGKPLYWTMIGDHEFVSIYDVITVHHISGPPNYDVVMTD